MNKLKMTWTYNREHLTGDDRFIVHFLNLNTEWEVKTSKLTTGRKYLLALERGKILGGKKFNNMQYGGGIIFRTSEMNLPMLEQKIMEITGRKYE